jgi:nitroreductase
MDLDEAIKNRRSIRNFTQYYVTDEEIHDVLEAARYAPSWANTQIWEFVVIRDRELINQVTNTYSETNPARDCSSKSSAIIVVCGKTRVSGCRNGKERTKFHEWFMFDAGLAVQNLCLKAHDIGLGTVIVGSMDHDRCKEILLLPDDLEVVAAIPMGKPAEDKKKVPARKEMKTFVFLDKYGEHYGKVY